MPTAFLAAIGDKVESVPINAELLPARCDEESMEVGRRACPCHTKYCNVLDLSHLDGCASQAADIELISRLTTAEPPRAVDVQHGSSFASLADMADQARRRVSNVLLVRMSRTCFPVLTQRTIRELTRCV